MARWRRDKSSTGEIRPNFSLRKNADRHHQSALSSLRRWGAISIFEPSLHLLEVTARLAPVLLDSLQDTVSILTSYLTNCSLEQRAVPQIVFDQTPNTHISCDMKNSMRCSYARPFWPKGAARCVLAFQEFGVCIIRKKIRRHQTSLYVVLPICM